MPEDSLTASVARLYRAGSEHSQQTQKARKAVDDLLTWMIKNLPSNLQLPCKCRLYPGGEFVQWVTDPDKGPHQKLEITRGREHSLSNLLDFSQLVSEGFLDELAKLLEDRSATLGEMTGKINSFIGSK